LGVAALGALGLWRNLIDFCHGNSVSVAETVVELGAMAPEEEKVTTIRLRKLVLRSVSLVGIESGCSRVNTGPLPVEVPVLSALQHGFRIRAPATEGDFQLP